MKKVKNFARFYALLNKVQGDTDGLKEQYVQQATDGRTSSLREMSQAEYNAMCDALQAKVDPGKPLAQHNAEIKRLRSAVLTRMQKLGVDTSDWQKVDNFCLNKRIMGKRFGQILPAELQTLIPKLEAMARKPRKQEQKPAPVPQIIHIPLELLNFDTTTLN